MTKHQGIDSGFFFSRQEYPVKLLGAALSCQLGVEIRTSGVGYDSSP